ncbi:PaaI family thioesterase [Alcaligenes aquatilis]|uniref:PaaI family thioesterase n=1 Tax=Alcaligenes aquatilis TaxID=323284 RepID=A0A3G2HVJ6_9BURK|nr:PaaI family thioesterase [Alcaligenes aquatilis]AYN20788.1 PaaI family thioesterase [Alcaligenes aquatilis]
MDDIKAFALKIFQSQAFSQFIGAELVTCSKDSAELALAVQDHHKQQHGFVHGGAISYLADNAITFAGGLALGGNALTVEFKINYIRPAIGTRLVAKAQARSAGKRMAICQCEVYAMDGESQKLCALAQGTVVPAT